MKRLLVLAVVATAGVLFASTNAEAHFRFRGGFGRGVSSYGYQPYYNSYQPYYNGYQPYYNYGYSPYNYGYGGGYTTYSPGFQFYYQR